jgi:hypothetical protein
MEHRFDSVILSRIGLSEAEARDFIAKHQAYLKSLTPAQYEAVSKSLPSWQAAAAAIHPDMTAADLQDFVARRGETPAPVSALCLMAPHRTS